VGKDTYNRIEALGAVLTIDGVISRRLGQAWSGQLDSVLTLDGGKPTCRPNMGAGHGEAGSWPNEWPSLGLEINRKKTALESVESGDEELGDVCRLLFGASKCLEPTKGSSRQTWGKVNPAVPGGDLVMMGPCCQR
jgi:hypothetical protein